MTPVRWITSCLMALLAFSFIVEDAHAGRVVRRERRQQARIGQGVQSGELTRGETRRLERGEARIEGARQNALSDGHMDGSERRHLNRMQNRESRRIWRAKHNERKAGGGADAPAGGGGAPAAPATPEQPSGQ